MCHLRTVNGTYRVCEGASPASEPGGLPAPRPAASLALGRRRALGWWWSRSKVPAFSLQESCPLAWRLPTTVQVRSSACSPQLPRSLENGKEGKPVTPDPPRPGLWEHRPPLCLLGPHGHSRTAVCRRIRPHAQHFSLVSGRFPGSENTPREGALSYLRRLVAG